MVDPPTEATVLGNFVHETLEALHKNESADRTLIEARKIMRSLWETVWLEKTLEVLPDDETKLHEFRWRAWWCVENYFSLEDPTAVNLDGIETLVDGPLGTATMKGFIDRWQRLENGSLIISDYKTGKTPRPQWAEDKFQQLLIYAALLSRIENSEIETLELLYLKDGVRLQRKVEKDDLIAIEEKVSAVHDLVDMCCETGKFPTRKARLCDWCSYKPFCPAWA